MLSLCFEPVGVKIQTPRDMNSGHCTHLSHDKGGVLETYPTTEEEAIGDRIKLTIRVSHHKKHMLWLLGTDRISLDIKRNLLCLHLACTAINNIIL